jgi:hypothetical protein
MLTKCAECGRDVSTKATTCPGCGAPVGISPSFASTAVQTVEATGKQWKMSQVVGVLLLLGGCVTTCAAEHGPKPGVDAWGVGAMGLGLFLWLSGRFGAWWHHG